MSILEKLLEIQTQIKAPKNLYNSLGKYNYRNAEGICEAVKPYLTKTKCALTLSDSVEACGDRVYISATAQLTDVEDGTSVSVKAYAREAIDKKGMDDSQVSGTASSYARKYALNGLFLLDDTKDADTDEYHVQTSATKGSKTANTGTKDSKPTNSANGNDKVAILKDLCARDCVDVNWLCGKYGVKSLSELPYNYSRYIVDNWSKIYEVYLKEVK